LGGPDPSAKKQIPPGHGHDHDDGKEAYHCPSSDEEKAREGGVCRAIWGQGISANQQLHIGFCEEVVGHRPTTGIGFIHNCDIDVVGNASRRVEVN
jgi:hypothetical protein